MGTAGRGRNIVGRRWEFQGGGQGLPEELEDLEQAPQLRKRATEGRGLVRKSARMMGKGASVKEVRADSSRASGVGATVNGRGANSTVERRKQEGRYGDCSHNVRERWEWVSLR